MHKFPSGKFETSDYRKATSADNVLQYDSNCLARHKCSRITNHCSNGVQATRKGTTSTDSSVTMVSRLIFIKRALRYQYSQPHPTTNGETVPKTCRALPYAKNVSKRIARHLRPFNFVIAHNPNKSLRRTLVNVKDSL